MSDENLNHATYQVLGVPITAVNLQTAADQIFSWAVDKKARYVGCRDVASLMSMAEDPALLKIANLASMNTPDGMPIALLGRMHGHDVERTCGPDLMEKLLTDQSYQELRHFFYGGKEGIAAQLAQRFRDEGANVVGIYCPPFRRLTEKEDRDVTQCVLESKADIVWVGISSPKQDIWIAEHLEKLPLTMIGVGAAFDFHSGAVKRAPLWMQKSGLEWLHRFSREPGRLWRRYLILAPKFLTKVIWGYRPCRTKANDKDQISLPGDHK
ncbi:WecB/TagA/CpsF family glycosyltransferase [Marivivens sp. LCG002]|uniref:WecB/TagA/CpsF family glycosyltransferase n=1 Tax=Marivivens sp. LCG002 TaxID=3051171 RepID=UPI002557724F|nr:WecB/TagA/CpsF family glycosyltransferase [Marivivens sp. LCG002]WIV49741.1 WecB/TagA/CpsF family glycosyltransferase [Marivivens sp. LCG002]